MIKSHWCVYVCVCVSAIRGVGRGVCRRVHHSNTHHIIEDYLNDQGLDYLKTHVHPHTSSRMSAPWLTISHSIVVQYSNTYS